MTTSKFVPEKRYFRSTELRVQQSGDGNTLTGYIAVFGSPSEPMYGYTEVLQAGCFASTLAGTNEVVALINHDNNAPVGRRSTGTLQLSEDETGLKFSIDLPNTTRANDLKESIKHLDVSGCSFGFICRKDQYLENEDGSVLRTIIDLDLLEVSVGVTFPAYTDTTSQLRSLPESMPVEIRARVEQRDKPAELLQQEEELRQDTLNNLNILTRIALEEVS
jgi:HK97 family phage prohead protease